MANQLMIVLIYLVVALSACDKTIDFGGVFSSTYRVDDRFEQSDAWNQTHGFKTLTSTTEDYQILVAGDSHVGGTENLNIFINESKKSENLAFVIVGDIVTGQKEDYLVFKNALPDFADYPYFLMIGNHDLYFDGWKTFYEYFGSSTYYFTVQTPQHKDIYICLDSGGGTLGGKQLEWLKDVLKNERANYRNCVVFSHVNFFRDRHTGSTNPLVTELEVLLPLFAENRVNMVIMGHDHVHAVDQLGMTTYLTMDALKDGVSNASYVQLKVSEEGMRYEFKVIE